MQSEQKFTNHMFFKKKDEMHGIDPIYKPVNQLNWAISEWKVIYTPVLIVMLPHPFLSQFKVYIS